MAMRKLTVGNNCEEVSINDSVAEYLRGYESIVYVRNAKLGTKATEHYSDCCCVVIEIPFPSRPTAKDTLATILEKGGR
jgi:ketopantoate hydroxymethyltransferase